ncbi:ABC-ATPase domain-containing protein [Clostridiisalibacter paucivorans]|uniref:ABC-ATPase domain-containing protein n=1 Tax=Clostridiisalibacter paucivorans TaxID=408753 RepID=UPI00047A1BFF|nr:ABC-ATPase domain-containing protein [Clostridiisalibacter paucivorans]
MKDMENLRQKLKGIDGRGYKAYKDIQGSYNFSDYILYVDYVQGDPFASPSRFRIRMNINKVGIPKEFFDNKFKKIAVEDFLNRSFNREIRSTVNGNRGTGKSGMIMIDSGGQEMLNRTAVEINNEYVEVRFSVGLPAKGRRILGLQAIKMIFEEIPHICKNAIMYKNINKTLLMDYVNLAVDQEHLRNEMKKNGLVSFIANGAILPRESGVSDKPMKGKNVVPFVSPKFMEYEFNLPNRGHISGMGIKEGVTLIVGGGYHGKSTLLNAIERGVYNHIPYDGREFVLTVEDAVKIRAEDGRKVEKVNITPFISNLPYEISTDEFTTDNASGSTSQAANIMEALEIGSGLLLLDEDTSATNFMIRDGRMQALVSKDKEPITPFIDRVRQLYEEKNVSTILVVGGSGDYFDVSDNIIMMENYTPYEVTSRAKEICNIYKNVRKKENIQGIGETKHRVPIKSSFRLSGKSKIKTKGIHRILYGRESIDLSFVEQLVDNSQTNAISNILRFMYRDYLDKNYSLKEIIDNIMEDIERKGLDIISPFNTPLGDLAKPRPYEIVAAINRYRKLEIR